MLITSSTPTSQRRETKICHFLLYKPSHSKPAEIYSFHIILPEGHILFILGEGELFYDRVTIWIIQRRMVLMNNYLERGGTDLIEVIFRHFQGRSEENHKNREVQWLRTRLKPSTSGIQI